MANSKYGFLFAWRCSWPNIKDWKVERDTVQSRRSQTKVSQWLMHFRILGIHAVYLFVIIASPDYMWSHVCNVTVLIHNKNMYQQLLFLYWQRIFVAQSTRYMLEYQRWHLHLSSCTHYFGAVYSTKEAADKAETHGTCFIHVFYLRSKQE